jgi:amyloid beta precursor protein binding protein 1
MSWVSGIDLFITQVSDALLSAVCGWGAREHAAVAAIIGGIGAQECIKLLTQQYTPLDNTLVYDSASAEAHVWKL